MNGRLLLLVLSASIAFGACAHRIAGEDLGGGFIRAAGQAGAGPSGEGANAGHLYFRGADLGEVGYVSVAPSGRYAIFERNAGLFLIESATGHLAPVTDGAFSKPKNVRWSEAEGFADIEYSDDHPTSRVALE